MNVILDLLCYFHLQICQKVTEKHTKYRDICAFVWKRTHFCKDVCFLYVCFVLVPIFQGRFVSGTHCAVTYLNCNLLHYTQYIHTSLVWMLGSNLRRYFQPPAVSYWMLTWRSRYRYDTPQSCTDNLNIYRTYNRTPCAGVSYTGEFIVKPLKASTTALKATIQHTKQTRNFLIGLLLNDEWYMYTVEPIRYWNSCDYYTYFLIIIGT